VDESHIRYIERSGHWRSKFGALLSSARPAPPGTLHHYTTIGGLQGILASGLLRAGHVRYCNDPYELRYASEVVRDYLSARRAALGDEVVQRAMAALSSKLDRETDDDTYVVCFTELPDDLNQWRAYAADGTGYALGFGTTDWNLPREWSLYKIVYERDDQIALLDQWIEAVSSARQHLPDGGADGEEEWIANEAFAAEVHRLFGEASLHFKAPDYKSEREWRLVYTRDIWAERLPVAFREGRRGLHPFVELKLRKLGGERLPLVDLAVGPRQQPSRSLATMDLFLREHRFYPELENASQEPVLDRRDQMARALFDPVRVRASKVRYAGA
jgi:hypothetical protein